MCFFSSWAFFVTALSNSTGARLLILDVRIGVEIYLKARMWSACFQLGMVYTALGIERKKHEDIFSDLKSLQGVDKWTQITIICTQ